MLYDGHDYDKIWKFQNIVAKHLVAGIINLKQGLKNGSIDYMYCSFVQFWTLLTFLKHRHACTHTLFFCLSSP